VSYEGRAVYQLLSDYQDLPLGGSGYLRIMTFVPQEDGIHVSTYSPYLDSYMEDEQNRFDLAFDMTGGTPPGGSVLVYSGLRYCTGTVAQGGCALEIERGEPVKAVYLGNMENQGSLASFIFSAAP
jgi:hypothetical protein